MNEPAQYLLAVDVGLSTGLALFDAGGRLLWYRSHHPATPQKLRKLIAKLLRDAPRPTHLYLEGGGPLADLWLREAEKPALSVTQISAEQWRTKLFHARQHKSGKVAKKQADILARTVIRELGGKNPTRLRHDTAEAILIGYYALHQLGWMETG